MLADLRDRVIDNRLAPRASLASKAPQPIAMAR